MRMLLSLALGVLAVFCGFAPGAKSAEPGPIDLGAARAHWLERGLVAWSAPADAAVVLLAAPEGGLADPSAPRESIALEPAGVVDGDRAVAFPHLSGMALWRLDPAAAARAGEFLRGQTAVATLSAKGRMLAATSLQVGPVLDDLYANDAPLGVTVADGAPSLAVWAPTARKVALLLYDSPAAEAAVRRDMARDDATGVWRVSGGPDWIGKYYLYEIEVYAPTEGKVVVERVTDPYAVSLSANGARAQIVDLSDPALAPEGFARVRHPARAPEDMAIYELHVRDFSIADAKVPPADRGKYRAFAAKGSNGMRHLSALARAGMTHVHLLPTFDCASVPERAEEQASPPDLSAFGPASEMQQQTLEPYRSRDAFNWCYDPLHYMAPDGAFASEPDGPARIYEFRQMVQGLHRAGLGVVLDVVFNHTRAAGRDPYSVLDRIAPGYYHRLDANGAVETSTCCANTASERAMMERLMVDAIVMWARAYKVDGFRFDLMGHHSLDNMVRVRAALDALTPQKDGVDGKAIYLYGEGWNFGEVANDSRFIQATQKTMGAGTGVGTFNDRLRDAVRGGAYNDEGEAIVRRQGFANGLYTAPNALTTADPAARAELLRLSDLIRVGLAGSISDFRFIDREGEARTAAEVDYNGAPGGYVSDPQEAVNYAAAHDNETLFDINAMKLPRDTSKGDRVRAQNMAASIVALAQGVPFFHAGEDMLRSKSLDRNSYDSGDWFNLLDFSYERNGWARGLPPAAENAKNWEVHRPLLEDENLVMGRAEIVAAAAHLREVLRIRKGEPLFRLRTGAEIRRRVRFLNTGPDQIAGLIVMTIKGDDGAPSVVAVFNATRAEQSVALDGAGAFTLHPVLRKSADPVVRGATSRGGALIVPALTTAVFTR